VKGFLLTFFFSLLLILSQQALANEAEALFRDYKSALYQIQLIEKTSGNKSAIGSGFQLSEDGLIATNYHVISHWVLNPKKYRIEYVDHVGNVDTLKAISVDVINDLAIVKRAPNQLKAFNIAQRVPQKGETVYSLGNPRDLGMVVVPGTYNGLKDKSFFPRIHFTGSINPGMSGGPAINSNGEVMGINVATAGNSIGFLVPVKPLSALLNSIDVNNLPNIREQMQKQLVDNQNQLMNQIMDHSWPKVTLGDASVPNEFAPFLPCWGESNSHIDKARYFSTNTSCGLGEDIYISSKFRAGIVTMQFGWLNSIDLLTHQFYNVYQAKFGSEGPDNYITKEFATDFQCVDDIVNTSLEHRTTVKAVFCTRAYKLFPDLYDVFYIAANTGRDDQGLISHFTLSGVNQSNAMRFLQRFMGNITWK
jgi:serine protease Do